MNKNIRELAMESGFPVAGFNKDTATLLNESAINKFALTLIKECVMIAELSDSGDTANQIKHHFGL